MSLQFPSPFKHRHPPVLDVNAVFDRRLTVGQRVADAVANAMGSWTFIVTQSALLAVWIVLNIVGSIHSWDPYPFILMNLLLSTQAAYAAPVIMMSQNRQAARDRIEAHSDFEVNEKTEAEVRAILDHLAAQDRALGILHTMITDLQEKLDARLPGAPG
ncbi:MAG TPA: DUF1003 domain-containing protein [Spirochaetia bacterium]|nr:DUF1003 domain-containing protein [Spirochaetia bacterium]